jgi:hypothetical protein
MNPYRHRHRLELFLVIWNQQVDAGAHVQTSTPGPKFSCNAVPQIGQPKSVSNDLSGAVDCGSAAATPLRMQSIISHVKSIPAGFDDRCFGNQCASCGLCPSDTQQNQVWRELCGCW